MSDSPGSGRIVAPSSLVKFKSEGVVTEASLILTFAGHRARKQMETYVLSRKHMPKHVKIMKSNAWLNTSCYFPYLDKSTFIMTWKFGLSDLDFRFGTWQGENLTHALAHLLSSLLPQSAPKENS